MVSNTLQQLIRPRKTHEQVISTKATPGSILASRLSHATIHVTDLPNTSVGLLQSRRKNSILALLQEHFVFCMCEKHIIPTDTNY